MISAKTRAMWFLGATMACSTSVFGQDSSSTVLQNVDGMWGFQAPAQYTILPRPATHTNKGLSNISTPPVANIQSRPTQPYAYGWFGTKASPQWSRQFGHQNAYTQWTLK